MSRVYWIPTGGKLRMAIAARPRSGDWLTDEIAIWQREGVGHVVSLLEPEEVSELGLQAEPKTCRAAGMAFTSFPIPDRGVPDDERAAILLAQTLG